MRSLAQKTPQTTSAKPEASRRAHVEQSRAASPIQQLQRRMGNQALQRMLEANTNKAARGAMTSENARHVAMSVARPTLVGGEGKVGEEVAGEPIVSGPEALDQTPAPVNEEGLIDGEWTSEITPHVFVNGGKTGAAIVHWAGGTGGGGNQGVGSIDTVAPVIDASAPAAAGKSAEAWVQAGTGTATVTRSYLGVLVGANGPNYYFTARAAARADRHEEKHVAKSRTHHNTFIRPLEARIKQRTGQAKALKQGADIAAAKAALNLFLDWNKAIQDFRTADTADNTPGGGVDTADLAAADYIKYYGPRTVAGVNYANYYDTPPGPGP